MIANSRPDAFGVRVAVRIFGFALRVLPTPMRQGFGVEMTGDFRGLARDAHKESGNAGVFFVLARSSADLVVRAVIDRRPNHDQRGLPLGERMSLLGHELKLAARTIAKRPGFTFVTVLTLALGIGANVAIFAVVNAVLIRPLPYPESERLVRINHHAPGLNLPELENSPGTWMVYERLARSFSELAAWEDVEQNLTGGAEPARITVVRSTPSLLNVLQVTPILGRPFVAADAKRGAPPVTVLTHTGWTTRFGAARDVIGRTLYLNGIATQIVGVLPKTFAYPDSDTDLLIPFEVDPNEGFGSFGMRVIARLADGTTLSAAQAEVKQLQRRIPEVVPDVTVDFLQKAGWSASVETIRDELVGDAETGLWIVLGTVGFLLLVACASVANLFLVRAESRQREVGIRFALGATRSRVAAIFLSESVLLGLAGGAWGILLAYAGLRALIAAAPAQLPRLHEVNLDFTVLLFAAAVSLIAGLLFGILPLPHQMRRPLHGIARDGRGHTAGRERQRVRKALIVTQIALALVLVTGSGLMLRTFQRLRSVEPGIQPDGVLTLGVSLGDNRTKPSATATYQRMINDIAALPGVRHAGAANALPLIPDGINGGSFRIKSKPRAEGALPPVAMYIAVSQNYFEAIGTPIIQGRPITRADHELNRPVVVVSESFVKSFLGDRVIGEHIAFGADSTAWIEVIGVARDVRTFGLREDIRPVAYLPMNIALSGVRIDLMHLIIRTPGDPTALAPAVRAVIKRIEPTAPILAARTMNDVLADSIADTSFTTTILTIAGLVALMLGAIGLYGVIGYVVSQRTQEIGVRIALGAVPTQVRTMVLRQGLALAAIGVFIGLIAAVALTRLLEQLLFGVSSRDLATFLVVPLVMLAVSSLAAYVPARRAAAVSPLQALRME